MWPLAWPSGRGGTGTGRYAFLEKETQKLALTANMAQSLAILEMDALELRSYLLRAVEENPLLDLLPEPKDLEPPYPQPVRKGPTEGELRAPPPTLRERLMSDIALLSLGEDVARAARAIVQSVDDDGYLGISLSEIAVLAKAPMSAAEAALRAVQSLDPPGIGARDPRECLLLQAARLGWDGLPVQLIEGHLEDLARGRYRKVARALKVGLPVVLSARDLIVGTLRPKPVSLAHRAPVPYVVPDVRVVVEGDEMTAALHHEALPRIGWNAFYREMAKDKDSEAKDYLARETGRARAILRSVAMRGHTLVRVTEAVLSRQSHFMRFGPGFLVPLTLRDVAQDLGLHESTVSRAVSGKYVLTPHGVVPLKSLFSPKASQSQEGLSQDAVRKAILEIVAGEDPTLPLGDREICEELAGRGISVARRTVAKYRQQLGIRAKAERRWHVGGRDRHAPKAARYPI